MSWEWVGPTGTSIVGLAGIIATYLAGKRQREVQFDLLTEQSRASERNARVEYKRVLYARLIGQLEKLLVISTARFVHADAVQNPAKYAGSIVSKIEEIVTPLLSEGSLTEELRSMIVSAVFAQRPDLSEMINSMANEAITKVTGVSLMADYDYQLDVLFAAAAEVELLSSGILAKSVREAIIALFQPLFGDVAEESTDNARRLIRALTQDFTADLRAT